MGAFIAAAIWCVLIVFIAAKVQQATREKTPKSKIEAKPLTREEKSEVAKGNLVTDKAIIEEAEISDPIAKKMAERFADKKFNQKLKTIINDD